MPGLQDLQYIPSRDVASGVTGVVQSRKTQGIPRGPLLECPTDMLIDDELDGLSQQVIGGGIRIHKKYGPGLLENAYRPPFVAELKAMGLRIEVDKPLPLVHNGVRVMCAYRIDILVEGKLLVELKSVERILPIHVTQVKTYLKLGDYKVGLLMNLNVEYLRYGIRRVLHPDLASKIPNPARSRGFKPPSPKSTAGFE